MARMRTIKPEFFRDPKNGAVSRDARILFVGIWTEADDHGRLLAAPKHIAGAIFPFDDDATPKLVERWIQELAATSKGGADTLIHLYEIDDVRYLHVVGWKHQKVDHPQPPRYPEPTCCANHSRAARECDATDSRSVRGQGSGVREEQGSGVRNQDASRDDVATTADQSRSQAPEETESNGAADPEFVRSLVAGVTAKLADAKRIDA